MNAELISCFFSFILKIWISVPTSLNIEPWNSVTTAAIRYDHLPCCQCVLTWSWKQPNHNILAPCSVFWLLFHSSSATFWRGICHLYIYSQWRTELINSWFSFNLIRVSGQDWFYYACKRFRSIQVCNMWDCMLWTIRERWADHRRNQSDQVSFSYTPKHPWGSSLLQCLAVRAVPITFLHSIKVNL